MKRQFEISDIKADELSQKAIESLRPGQKDDDLDEPVHKGGSRGICLCVNTSRFYMEGFRGVLELQLKNLGDLDFDSVKVEVSGDLLGRTEHWSSPLKPCKEVNKRFPVKPEDPGVNLVQFRVTARQENEVYAFWGEEDFAVFRESEDIRQISIQAEKLIDNSVSDNAKSMGNIVKNQIGSMFNFDKIKNANDLMREIRDLPPQYQMIPLEYDPDRSEQIRNSMTVSVSKQKQIIEPQRGSMTESASVAVKQKGLNINTLLIAKNCLTLGKNRKNDIVTRVCPRTPINDSQTNHMSRQHSILELTEDGLLVKDANSANGTTFDGKKIDLDGTKYKGRGKELELAGALKLKVDCLAKIRKLDPSDYEDLMEGRVSQLWAQGREASLNSITLQRVDNLGPEDPNGTEQYVIVYRVATVGSNPHCSMFFEDRGLEPVHAAIIYMNSRFYLENMTEDLTDVFVNDKTLSKNELMPLNFGDQLRIARLKMDFMQQSQLFIDT